MIALAKPDNLIAFPDVAPQGKSNEWYTPSRYIEAARKVMGSIDLDPASCKEANLIVKAKQFYAQHDNGLRKPWYGKVWLNPPYGSTDGESNIGAFTRRLVAEYEDGNVEQAILLSTTKTSSSWFDLLWQYPICFTNHNINFDCPIPNKNRFNGKACHIHGTIFVYFGPNEQKFIEVFSQFGRIAKAIDTPKVQPVNLSLWEVQS